MQAEELKQKISIQMMFDFLDSEGAEPDWTRDGFDSITICHGGDSHKLSYKESIHSFTCWTNCGHMDILSLIAHIFEIDEDDFPTIMEKTGEIFGIDVHSTMKSYGDFSGSRVKQRSFLPSGLKSSKKFEFKPLKEFDSKILDTFYDKPANEWVYEGITPETQHKFGIRLNLIDEQIVIPEYDLDNRLIGIRVRNTINAESRKYAPLYYNKQSYRFPTGENLYGANVNKDLIKQTRKLFIYEGEKSVLKMDSFYNGAPSVALNGWFITDEQMYLIRQLKPEEIIIGLDKDYNNIIDELEYRKKVGSVAKSLATMYNVTILWDIENQLDFKDSPVDQGKEVFENILQKRVPFGHSFR